MAEVAPRPLSPEDEEAKGTPRTDGETRPRDQKAGVEKRTKQEAREKEDAEQRRRDFERERKKELVRERREAQESAEKTAKAAQKAIEALRAAAQPQKSQRPEPRRTEQPPEGPRFIASEKPLIALSREAVVEAVRKAGLSIEVPENWEKMDFLKRARWFSDNKLRPITKFPEQPEDTGGPELVYETKLGSLPVSLYRRPDGSYVMSRLPSNKYDAATVKQLLEGAGIAEKVKLPEDFDSLQNIDDKIGSLRQLGVDTLPEVYAQLEEQTRKAEYWVRQLGDSVARGETESQRRLLREGLLANDYQLDATSYVLTRLLWLKHQESTGVLKQEERNEVQALEELLDFLVDEVNSDDYGRYYYSFVDRFAKTIKNLERRASDLGGDDERLLGQVKTNRRLESVKNRRDQLDSDFQTKYDRMSTSAKNDLFGRFNEEAATMRKSIGNYIGSIRLVRENLTSAIREAIHREFPTQKGIAEWYTTKIVENLEAQLIEESQLGVPNNWEDSMKHVLNNLRYAESFDSVQQVQIAIGNIDRIAAAIPVTTASGKDPEDELRIRGKAKNLQDEIVQLRDSVYVVLQLRETMAASSMDPEKVVELANSPLWKDTTWKLFFSRFFKDHEQKDFLDKNGQKFNLLDKAMQVYFRRFRDEKRRMNAIEELTKNKLDLNLRNLDYDKVKNDREQALEHWKDWDKKWLILRVLAMSNPKDDPDKFQRVLGETFDDLIKVSRKPPIDPQIYPGWENWTVDELKAKIPDLQDWTGEEIRENVRKQIEKAFAKLMKNRSDTEDWLKAVNEHWSHTSGIFIKFLPQVAITDWFRNNTLLGVDIASVDNKETRRSLLDLQRQQLLGELEQKLRGVEVGVSDEVIKGYRDAQLLTQVINNAYHVTWMWGAFSEYGGIRVFNRDKVWYRNRDGNPVYQVGELVYSGDSRLFNGRMDDWFNEFLIDERRGKAGGGRLGKKDDVDYAFTRNMIGRRKGILHHNRLLTKLVNDNLRLYVDNLIDGKMVSQFNDRFVEFAKDMENIDYLRVDWSKWGTEELGDFYDMVWARGVAIAEMIEDGEITLENVEWSRDVFTNPRANIRKYNMGDWWEDRVATHKFFGSGALQKYLQVPGTEEFNQLNTIENFYSKREIRIKPWYKLIIPAHFEIGKHWQEWFKLPYDMTIAEKEVIVNEAVVANRIEAADHGWMKDKHLGTSLNLGPINTGPLPVISPVARWFRKYAELADVAARETGKRAPALFLLFLWEFFKAFFTQGQAQLSGK